MILLALQIFFNQIPPFGLLNLLFGFPWPRLVAQTMLYVEFKHQDSFEAVSVAKVKAFIGIWIM